MLILFASFLITPVDGAVQIDIVGSPSQRTLEGGGEFNNFYLLPNGNIVVADYEYTPLDMLGGDSLGRVYLFNGATGQLISHMTGTSPGDGIGNDLRVLPNGNFFVISEYFDNLKGAVTLCSGVVGCPPTISSSNSLVGSTPGDRIGDGSQILSNGNLVTFSMSWNNNLVAEAGAVTLCSGTSGCTGVVSAANSLVGTTAQDLIGMSVTALTDGNFVVTSTAWDNGAVQNAGAAVWCSGTIGCSGDVTTANSIHGTSTNDGVADYVVPLANGRYAVSSPVWTNGGPVDVGAVTWCGAGGVCAGAVSTANSLFGSNDGDFIGSSGIHELPGGAVVVASPSWQNGSQDRAGAVTFCSDFAACIGAVNTANSLTGQFTNDRVGITGLTVLTNGNYVVGSSVARIGAATNAGAATFCSGITGCTGNLTQSNSLVGLTGNNVGNSIWGLPNGNYFVVSPGWDGVFQNSGAVTFCDGSSGCTGLVTSSNSLIGAGANEQIGASRDEILENGNFVIRGQNSIGGRGAITFCSGTTGCPSGPVSSSNSLTGSDSGDSVGSAFVVPLENGDYVVKSPLWDLSVPGLGGGSTIANVGAATYCSGVTGCTGVVSEANSLIGSSQDDQVGEKAIKTGTGVVIVSPHWDNGAIVDVGAATNCNSQAACIGAVSTSNSLFGSSTSDLIGNEGLVTLSNGDAAILSSSFNNDLETRKLGFDPSGRGAVTYINSETGLVGEINSSNSVLGTNLDQYFYEESVTWDPANEQLVAARGSDQIISLFRLTTPQPAPFDFDGDGRTDISVFRPSTGTWWIDRSTDGLVAANFGLSTDILTPADFDGDGKTDIAVWRAGLPTQARFFILNSSDFSVSEVPFGQTGDDPYVVGDWDGDGKADPSIYRDSAAGSASRFYYQGSDNNPGNAITFLNWGITGDEPLRGDFDGDGKRDMAVFRPSDQVWYINRSSDASVQYGSFGFSTDKRLEGDFDGDGKTDLAVYRESELNWYYLRSSNLEAVKFPYGLAGDQLAPGDYDGDGKTDVAVFRNGQWIINNSGSGLDQFTGFGISGDIAVPSGAVGN